MDNDLRGSNDPSERSYQTIGSGDFDKFRGKYLSQFDPLRDFHFHELQHVKDYRERDHQEFAAKINEPD
jgi:hypothetical protein